MSDYEYNYTYVAPLALVQTVPRQDKPSLQWYLKVIPVVLRLVKNRLAPGATATRSGLASMGADDSETLPLDHLGLEPIDLAHADLDSLDHTPATPASGLASMGALSDVKLVAQVAAIAASMIAKNITDPFGVFDAILAGAKGTTGRPSSLDDYRALFKTLPLPAVADSWQEDATFAALRVAGYNPMVIVGVHDVGPDFPVTDAFLAAAGLGNDTLADAGEEGRLYLADYAALADVQNGNFPDGPKYCFAPKALFVRPRASKRLVPVAIQCGQDPAAWPVYKATDGEAWARAKIAVNCADANYHELISHLGRTHLICEVFAIATPRRLPEGHPVRTLLTPHYEGTLSINDSAQATLITAGNQVDKAMAGTIDASRLLSATAVIHYDFEGSFLPTLLKTRRVMDPGLDYPYRDDALAIWGALHDWVTANIQGAYASDEALQADTNLAAWAHEIAAQDGGRLYTFGEGGQAGTIRTRAWLADALTHVIFTGSAQHAAVNFAQAQIMAYAPAVAGGNYRNAPVSVKDATLSPQLDMFPPLDMAQLQMEFLTLLGGVYYTQLGQYARGQFGPTLLPALLRFQAALAQIEVDIDAANANRTSYTLLKPSQIPQSINI